MRGSPSLTLLEWKPGQVPLLSRGSRHWEGEGEGKGGKKGKVDCALSGVFLQGGSGQPHGSGLLQGRGRSQEIPELPEDPLRKWSYTRLRIVTFLCPNRKSSLENERGPCKCFEMR